MKPQARLIQISESTKPTCTYAYVPLLRCILTEGDHHIDKLGMTNQAQNMGRSPLANRSMDIIQLLFPNFLSCYSKHKMYLLKKVVVQKSGRQSSNSLGWFSFLSTVVCTWICKLFDIYCNRTFFRCILCDFNTLFGLHIRKYNYCRDNRTEIARIIALSEVSPVCFGNRKLKKVSNESFRS